jgi:hypothetical protein
VNSSRVNLQHRPFLTPIWITVGAAAAAFLFALFLIWVWGTAGSTTVIVVPEDPAADEGRAASLIRMFGARGPGSLDAIYVTNLPRSHLLVSPLAERLHITPDNAPADPKALARLALGEHGGGRVLVVAQSDLFAKAVESLSGARDIPSLAAGDLGVIYVVTVPRIGHANLLRLSY